MSFFRRPLIADIIRDRDLPSRQIHVIVPIIMVMVMVLLSGHTFCRPSTHHLHHQ
jgi:hypothetical protein